MTLRNTQSNIPKNRTRKNKARSWRKKGKEQQRQMTSCQNNERREGERRIKKVGGSQQQQPNAAERGNDIGIEFGNNEGNTPMEEVSTKTQQKEGGIRESNEPCQKRRKPKESHVLYRRTRNDDNQQDILQDNTLMSLKIRSFNGEE
jgi:hypothetical protein